MKNKTCKKCGITYHVCSSCGIGFYESVYIEDFCTFHCYSTHELYKQQHESYRQFLDSLSPDQIRQLHTILNNPYLLDDLQENVDNLIKDLTND